MENRVAQEAELRLFALRLQAGAHHLPQVFGRSLRLDGLESIATDVAAALEPHRSLLSLDRIRQVDAATAAVLARHAGPLKMGSLERIDSDVLFTKLLGDVPRDDAFHWFM